MSRPAPEMMRRWVVPASLLAVAPKCVLCVLAYAGLGTALDPGGPELCGATPDSGARWVLLPIVLGAMLAFAALVRRAAAKTRQPAISP